MDALGDFPGQPLKLALSKVLDEVVANDDGSVRLAEATEPSFCLARGFIVFAHQADLCGGRSAASFISGL